METSTDGAFAARECIRVVQRCYERDPGVHEDVRQVRVCLEAEFTVVTATSALLVTGNFCKSPWKMRCRVSRVTSTRSDATRRQKALALLVSRRSLFSTEVGDLYTN